MLLIKLSPRTFYIFPIITRFRIEEPLPNRRILYERVEYLEVARRWERKRPSEAAKLRSNGFVPGVLQGNFLLVYLVVSTIKHRRKR